MKEKPAEVSDVPDRKEEEAGFSQGYRRIAGLDEAGRGSLAGPVVAAAVILPRDAEYSWLQFVRDSKLLQEKTRRDILRVMTESGIEVGIGTVSAAVIDEINILNATKKAMKQALRQLPAPPDYVLCDAVKLPRLGIAQKAIIKGDRTCLVISCASIAAKVARDHIMLELDAKYRRYRFRDHKGYGTEEHLKLLKRYGACKIHRFTFAPVRELAKIL